jgi:hypothetical protein
MTEPTRFRTAFPALPKGAEQRPILETIDDRGCLLMHHPIDGVLVTRAAGHMALPTATRWIESTKILWRQPVPVRIFNDWEKLDSYDSKARRQLTEWVILHRTHISGAWFLTGSRIVAMGVATASAATAFAGVTLHASRERSEWSARLASVLEASSGRSDPR